MNRLYISNTNCMWFDSDKAEVIRDRIDNRGLNSISLASNDHDTNEHLYLTASGKWILNRFSIIHDADDKYFLIDENEAFIWLLKQNLPIPPSLEKYLADTEI